VRINRQASIQNRGESAVIVTVILCTHNRCQSLVRALESVAVSTLPDSVEWEVLVVDNNSNDHTREAVEDLSRKNPVRFRYLFEPQPGKSFALNSGIRAARGDVLAFMDDDVLVEPTWLRNLTAVLHSGEWAGAGGRILPQWASPPPHWIPLKERHALGLLALFDLGPEAGPLGDPPFGTNMAFRKAVFEKYDGFRTDLGPRPGSEIRSEDTEFGRRLLNAGERLWYEPSAVVYHPVPPNRLRRQYFLRWWFDKGRADLLEFGVPNGTRSLVARIPMNPIRRLVSWTLRWMAAFEPTRRFSCKLKVWWLAGWIVESYRQLNNGRTERLRSQS
jgi:glycosyltransferase involved in cell wall biosynthesis